jgi:IS30 family transposase
MRTRSSRHMNAEERATLSRGLACGHALRTMAAVLKRAPRTGSRAWARNGTRGQPSRASTAPPQAAGRARQPHRPRNLLAPWRWQDGRTHLAEGGSPEQIAGRLRRASPDDRGKPRSAETLEAGLDVVPRGTRRRALVAARRSRARGPDRRGQIPPMTPLVARPAEGATRTVPGHREGALITGARHGSAVGTLGERTTRLVSLARMTGTEARRARAGFIKTRRPGPALLRQPLPDARGKARAEHDRLAERLASRGVFADPYRPGQRGTHENTKGLLASPGPRARTCRATPRASCTPSPIA